MSFFKHFKNQTQSMNPYASTNFRGAQGFEGKSGAKGSDRLVIE